MFAATELLDASKELGSLEGMLNESTDALLKAHEAGFKCGKEWPAKWGNRCPGGPWVNSVSSFRTDSLDSPRGKAWVARCKQSQAENDAWRAGWKLGYASQS